MGTAVDGHCIVIHDTDELKTRVGVGKIICTDEGCKATMGPYPTDTTTTTPTTTTTTKPTPKKPDGKKPPVDVPVLPTKNDDVETTPEVEVDGVATMLLTVSAVVFYSTFA